MIWKRHDFGMKASISYLSVMLVVFILALLLQQFLLLAILSVPILITLVAMLYYKRVGKGLELVNEKKRTRLLIGTDGYFELVFINKGLPIWNSTLQISFPSAVSPIGLANTITAGLHEVKIPFSIGYKKKVKLRIPIQGIQRGQARIKQLEISIPHPLMDGSIQLDYHPFILTDAIVFPKIYQIAEDLVPSRFKQGHLELKSSLFDDPFLLVGTREYQPGDQFHHIHWKASAKMQSLQTKVFTKVANVSVLFVVNVVEKYGITTDFEDKLSWLASHIETCYKAELPFSFAINIRATGKTPFISMPVGSGDNHRIQALELLSLISPNASYLSFEKMLAYINAHEELPTAVYVVTNNAERYKSILDSWEQRAVVFQRDNVRRKEHE